jgi:hypothetical protein
MMTASLAYQEAKNCSPWQLQEPPLVLTRILNVLGECHRNCGVRGTRLFSFPSVSSRQVEAHGLRIAPCYTKCVINRQFNPLEVVHVGCTQALTSRQSASLAFARTINQVSAPQSPGTFKVL